MLVAPAKDPPTNKPRKHSVSLFHVACELTGAGAPPLAADPASARLFATNASRAWSLWKEQQRAVDKPIAYSHSTGVAHVLVPALVQEQHTTEDAALEEQRLVAEHHLRNATHAAHTAVKRAVEAARRADLTLSLPTESLSEDLQALVAQSGNNKPVDFAALRAQQQEVRAAQAKRQQEQQQHAAALEEYRRTNQQAAAQLKAYEQQVQELKQRKAEAAVEMQHYEDHGREKRKAAEAARNFASKVDEDEDDDYEEEEDDYYKTKPRAAPKAAGGYGRGESASIQDVLGLRPGYSIGSITKAPDDKYLLKPEDLRSGIVGRWLWVYWEDDAHWWPAKVISVVRSNPYTVLLLYETGDEEPELDLSELVEKQQVAWLHHEAVPDTTPRGAPKPKPKPKRNYSDDEEEYLEEEEDDDEAELDDDDDDFDPRYADAKSPRKKAKKKKPRTSSMPQQARPMQPQQHYAHQQQQHAAALNAYGYAHAQHAAMQQPMSELMQLLHAGHRSIGRKVQVFFPQLGQWVRASVVMLDPNTQSVELRLDSGEMTRLYRQHEHYAFKLALQ